MDLGYRISAVTRYGRFSLLFIREYELPLYFYKDNVISLKGKLTDLIEEIKSKQAIKYIEVDFVENRPDQLIPLGIETKIIKPEIRSSVIALNVLHHLLRVNKNYDLSKYCDSKQEENKLKSKFKETFRLICSVLEIHPT